MDRRIALLGGAASLSVPAWGAEKVKFAIPDGACNAHHHIYDPRFPYLPDVREQVPATVADYFAFRRKMRMSRDVIVLPSAYGTNNDPLLFFQGQSGNNTRSIAVVRPDESDATLRDLNAAGVRGVRIQFRADGSGLFKRDEIAPIARRIAPYGWHVQFHMPGKLLAELEPVLLSLPTPIVVDHMGHASSVDQPQYRTVRKILDTSRGWIKVSGINMDSKVGPPGYTDTAAVAREYIRANPNRVVWGSNWPFPGEVPAPNIAVVLNVLASETDSPRQLHNILVENPEALYGFDPTQRPSAAL